MLYQSSRQFLRTTPTQPQVIEIHDDGMKFSRDIDGAARGGLLFASNFSIPTRFDLHTDFDRVSCARHRAGLPESNEFSRLTAAPGMILLGAPRCTAVRVPAAR